MTPRITRHQCVLTATACLSAILVWVLFAPAAPSAPQSAFGLRAARHPLPLTINRASHVSSWKSGIVEQSAGLLASAGTPSLYLPEIGTILFSDAALPVHPAAALPSTRAPPYSL